MPVTVVSRAETMARGQQKIQSQQKAAEKAKKAKKGSVDQKKAGLAGLTYSCKVCMVRPQCVGCDNKH